MAIFPAGYPEKVTPNDNDKFLVADADDSNAVKYVKKVNIFPEWVPDRVTDAVVEDTELKFTISETEPDPDPNGKVIVWFEPLS